MPLLKQEIFLLAETPEDLSPDEMVFQVRFTKEIFRDYDEFVKRMNLYRQKVWTCKATGKGGLTYEKALVSECRAAQRTDFPRDFMAPILRMVQFSALQLEELLGSILKTFSERYVAGEVVSIVRDGVVCRCKVLDVSEDGGDDAKSLQYEVGWLDADGRVKNRSSVNSSELLKRNPPFSREALKKFVQESAYGDELPWLVRDKLVRKFKLPSEPPEGEKQIHARQDPNQRQVNQAYFDESLQEVEYTGKKRNKRHRENGSSKSRKESRKNEGCSSPQQSEELVDDSLLEPDPNDPRLPRPVPCSEFAVEADCVGPLLMVWDFCNSFTKLLQLTQFSLYDLERALLFTEGESVLLSETYFAILRVVLGEHGVKQRLAQRRKRKVLLTIDTWKDDLCDYLELEGPQKLKCHVSTFRKDWYSNSVVSKLAIFEELIERAISTSAVRSQLEEYVEEHESLSTQKRAEGLPISMRKGSRFTKLESPEKAKLESPEKSPERYENGYGEDASPRECFHENGCLIGWMKKGKRKRLGNLNGAETKREYSARCLFFNSARQTFRVELHDERDPQSEKEKAESMLQRRLENIDRELEKCTVRVTSLGKDRDHNRYWFFHREGRIFVESEDSKHWSFYSSKKELDELYESLNRRGAREKALRDQIESSYSKMSSSMQRRSREMMQRTALEEANIRRSLRVQSAPRPTGFLAYVNKMRLSLS